MLLGLLGRLAKSLGGGFHRLSRSLRVRLGPYRLRAGTAEKYPEHHRCENGQPESGVDDVDQHQPTCPVQIAHGKPGWA
ncbi:hypothetical protein ACK8N7_00365 [Streptomyces griseobrunneus]